MTEKSPSSRPTFLEAVLANDGQTQMTDLKQRIVDVTQSVSQLKLRVDTYMKSKYIDFDPLLKKTKGYLDKAVRTSDEINDLFNSIEFQTKLVLTNSTGELRNLHASLKENSAILAITTELLQMESAMKDVEAACERKQYVDAAKSLQSFREFAKNSSKETQQLDIFTALHHEFNSLFVSFRRENAEKLNSFISWESTDVSQTAVRSTIKIKSGNKAELQEVSHALHLVDMLTLWMDKFKSFLMKSILLPLIKNEATVTFVEEGEAYSSMQVLIKKSSQKPAWSTTLDNLTKCFEFLHDELDMQYEDESSFISLLGQEISKEFTDSLIKDCLKQTITSPSAEVKYFPGIQDRVTKFNVYMIAIEFLSEENESLIEYVQNFDKLCTNSACENYLKEARDIMSEDLQDMMEVGPQTPTPSLISTLDSTDSVMIKQEITINVSMKPENELNSNLFQFPSCFVSKSTLKILDLVGTILKEVTKNTTENELYHIYLETAKSVIELYMAVVPFIHRKLLETIPQQVALFHNNCMYLAHHLVLLSSEVMTSLKDIVKVEIPVIFVDLVHSLRHLGTVTYLKHMQKQRKQILDLMKESGLATLGENSELSDDTERSLKQCLRQLELLKSVWQNILPQDVYSKSIGALANAFIEELVVRVSSVEDIPANTAVKLTTHFKMVEERIPELFENGNKIVLYVKRWLQFQELITILGASLREIEERWADGKGPLAHEFTSEQVKQMIRALFQNTKRRAEVLSKVK